MRQSRFLSAMESRGITPERMERRRIASCCRHIANFIPRLGSRPLRAGGELGGVKIKRVSCVCFTHPRSVGRSLRWRCVQQLSRRQSRRLRHGRTIIHGAMPMRTIWVVMGDGITPFVTSATWRIGRVGMRALPTCERTAFPAPMPASGRIRSLAASRHRVDSVRRVWSLKRAVTSAAIRPVAPACGARAS